MLEQMPKLVGIATLAAGAGLLAASASHAACPRLSAARGGAAALVALTAVDGPTAVALRRAGA